MKYKQTIVAFLFFGFFLFYPVITGANGDQAFSWPTTMTVDNQSNKLYVLNFEEDKEGFLTIVDGKTQKALKIVPVGKNPRDLKLNNLTGKIYITNSGSDSVSVFDTKTEKIIKEIPVAKDPRAITINKTLNKIYVASFSGSGSLISIIDGESDEVVNAISAAGSLYPSQLIIDELKNRLYVGSSVVGNLTVVDTSSDSVLSMVEVGLPPMSIRFNYDNRKVYVVSLIGRSVSIIDGEKGLLIKNISLGSKPLAFGINHLTNKIYIADEIDNEIWVIDGEQDEIIKKIKLKGRNPVNLKIDYLKNLIYVANEGSQSVDIINGQNDEVESDIFVNKPVYGMMIDENARKLYISNLKGGTVTVIDLDQQKIDYVSNNLPKQRNMYFFLLLLIIPIFLVFKFFSKPNET